MDWTNIVILGVVIIAAYVLAKNITGLNVGGSISDLTAWTLKASLRQANTMQKKNQAEFSMLSQRKKQASFKYKYFHFLNELLLDMGWRRFGITPEVFTILDIVAMGGVVVLLYPVIPNIIVSVYLFSILFVLVIAIMFAVSRINARHRTRKLIAAENLICGNMTMGFQDAVASNLDLIDSSLRPAFINFLDQQSNQNFDLAVGLASLNEELGDHSTQLLKRVLIYETEKRPGQEDMFRFIMQMNIREEERAQTRDIIYSRMNVNFFQCVAVLMVFLVGCIASMPEVVRVYVTLGGKIVLAIFFSLVALGYIYVQIQQSKPFKYMPTKL